jgi:hypothetical protein
MTISVLADSKKINHKKVDLKLQYKTLKSATEDKFEAWITTIEDRWAEEIEACLQGKFPDWRGE